jgi:hypothetical protein
VAGKEGKKKERGRKDEGNMWEGRKRKKEREGRRRRSQQSTHSSAVGVGWAVGGWEDCGLGRFSGC